MRGGGGSKNGEGVLSFHQKKVRQSFLWKAPFRKEIVLPFQDPASEKEKREEKEENENEKEEENGEEEDICGIGIKNSFMKERLSFSSFSGEIRSSIFLYRVNFCSPLSDCENGLVCQTDEFNSRAIATKFDSISKSSNRISLFFRGGGSCGNVERRVQVVIRCKPKLPLQLKTFEEVLKCQYKITFQCEEETEEEEERERESLLKPEIDPLREKLVQIRSRRQEKLKKKEGARKEAFGSKKREVRRETSKTKELEVERQKENDPECSLSLSEREREFVDLSSFVLEHLDFQIYVNICTELRDVEGCQESRICFKDKENVVSLGEGPFTKYPEKENIYSYDFETASVVDDCSGFSRYSRVTFECHRPLQDRSFFLQSVSEPAECLYLFHFSCNTTTSTSVSLPSFGVFFEKF